MWVLKKGKKGERDGFGLKPQQERDSFSFVINYLIDLWFGSPNVCHHVLLINFSSL